MTPLLVDGESMRNLPVDELLGGDTESSLLGNFTHTYRAQRLVGGRLAAGYRLPEARMIRSLDEEHIQCRRVEDDEHRLRNFAELHWRALMRRAAPLLSLRFALEYEARAVVSRLPRSAPA
jgi:hypothetical protein